MAKPETDKVVVFVNRQKVEFSVTSITGADFLTQADFEGKEWDLLLLQGEGDPTGGDVILATATIGLKNGMHFRVIPGNRTFG